MQIETLTIQKCAIGTILAQELFFSGTETISTTVEWAMCELFRNSDTMVKIKAELGRVVGANKKLEETDIDNLHYLRATVKETLRMHPPAPLLFPRTAIHDISNLMGYNIPKDTQVWINAWAIGMDEECWEDALSFKPERFLDSSIGYKGHNFEFIPFGAGRRICAGLPLAHRVMPLILGPLLHHFDWELCENLNSKTKMDMREAIGATARKLEPLKAVPRRSVCV